ncbi:MAG: hypothetical protein GYA02_08810 [Clostridiaceae bacterium]|nr:hypothetical protein [Clostridiaceae bacterium]
MFVFLISYRFPYPCELTGNRKLLKAAEDGDGLIMRLYESSDKRGRIKIDTIIDINSYTECNLSV